MPVGLVSPSPVSRCGLRGEVLPGSVLVEDYLSGPWTLVPVPGHAPMVRDRVWPARRVCEAVRNSWIGQELAPCLVRTETVTRSSAVTKGRDRPSPEEHFRTLEVTSWEGRAEFSWWMTS